MALNVAIADDHSAVRIGMKYLVSDWMPGSIIHFADNIPMLAGLLNANAIDILILDFNIPGGDNFNTIGNMKQINPSTKVLVMSAYDEHLYALRCIDMGADGYLQKDSGEEEIKRALSVVYNGGKYVSEEVKDFMLRQRMSKGEVKLSSLSSLSNRELEVCNLLAKGQGISEIARQLFIHTSTVGTYKSKIFYKLGVNNIKELISVVDDKRY